jgi:hypothetical protein
MSLKRRMRGGGLKSQDRKVFQMMDEPSAANALSRHSGESNTREAAFLHLNLIISSYEQ